MRHTNRQTTTRTLTDLYRALDRRTAITITYLKPGDTEPTVRTIEIAEFRTTKAGGIVIIAMCRLRADERQFHLSGIQAYTLHRIGYVLDRPEPTTYQRPEPAPIHDVDALIAYELARDPDDADYRPRVTLAA
jgi:predicted DNA-binding transcriptional regulator YafY